jgi:hypothetical protein
MGMPQIITLIIALPIGCAAGSVLISSAARIDSIYAIAASLVCLPAGWLVKTKRRVVLNVLQGWLVAIAVLGISLPIITPTPGYAPDHKE